MAEPVFTSKADVAYALIRQRIEAAAQRAGRDPGTVRLTAVTKYVDPPTARIASGVCSVMRRISMAVS